MMISGALGLAEGIFAPGQIVKKITFNLGIDKPFWMWYTQFIKRKRGNNMDYEKALEIFIELMIKNKDVLLRLKEGE